MTKKIIVGTLVIAVFFILKTEKTSAAPANFINSLVTSGLSLPTDTAFTPDGRILITQQNGAVVVFKNNQLLATPAISLNVGTGGDRGLISIVLDPNFGTNNTVYLLYTSSALHERISKFTMTGDTINPASEQVLLENPTTWGGFLNAGAVRFGPDGKLYATMGSNGQGTAAQDLAVLEGKMVRINSDGTIPADNPFAGTAGAQKAIFATGFRNPWRFNFDSTGHAIVGDVGQSTWEKIVRVFSGANYGWPTFEGDCTPNCGGVTPPLFALPHNGQGMAVVGGDLSKGNNFPGTFANTWFFGDYVQNYIKIFGFDASNNPTPIQTFDAGDGTLSDIKFAPDGCLAYLDIFPGELHKICYGGSVPVLAVPSADKTYGTLPLTVQFSSASSTGSNLSFSWNFGDGSATSTQANPSHAYTAQGVYTVTLTAAGTGGSSSANLTIWAGFSPPSLTITAPANNSHYNGGSTINFSAVATDPKDGNLPPVDFIWSIIPHHNTHIHTPVEFNNVNSGSFQIPQNGEPGSDTYFEFKATATDSVGLATTTSIFIFPNLSNITVSTNPSALQILLDGQPHTAPHTETNVVGMNRTVSVNSPQIISGTPYNFSSWSDGGAITHQITIPSVNATYTANFTPASTTPGTLCSTPATNAFNGCYYSDMTLTNLVLERTDPNIAFLWNPGESPDPAVPPFGWSSSWTGNFDFAAGSYEFDATVDDGVRLFIDGVKVIDGWKDQGATLYTATQNLTAGTHTIRMEFYQNGGQAQAYLTWKQVGTPTPPPPVGGSCPAAATGSFTGCYYNDMVLGNFVLSHSDPTINFDWGGGSPDPSLPTDNFSARWQGNFDFNAASYTFTATADDGVRVFVDGNLIIDKFIDQPTTTYTATQAMTSGSHLIKVEYYEHFGGAVAKVSWAQSGVTPPPPAGGSCPAAGTNAFTGCYYKDQNFTTFGISRTDAYPLNFDWGGGSPDPAIPVDHFSARWQGNFNFNASDYTFTATGDDGIRVLVDGTVIIDKFIDQPPTTYTAIKTLAAGTHLVQMDYYENGGGAVAKLSWAQSVSTPPPPPPPPPTTLNFVTSASLPAGTFSPGANTTVTTNVTATADLPNVLIDTEIFNGSGIKVAQNSIPTSLMANQQFSNKWNLTLPTPTGTYVVKVAVFSQDWSKLYFWNNGAASFNIGSAPPPPAPGQTYTINVLQPANGATVTGTVEIRAVINGLDINSYNIGWRTGSGAYFNLDTDPVTQSFKHAWIDFTTWTWNANHQYPLEFQATDLNNNAIGHTQITVMH